MAHKLTKTDLRLLAGYVTGGAPGDDRVTHALDLMFPDSWSIIRSRRVQPAVYAISGVVTRQGPTFAGSGPTVRKALAEVHEAFLLDKPRGAVR